MSERIDQLADPTLFLSGPAEFLAARVAANIALVPQFLAVFGSRIDPYTRHDYGARELPALRVYNEQYVKQFESWFIEGEICLDVILPPSTHRSLQQAYSDTITAALCQQFRRPTFFDTLCSEVPGLNELGKTFSADKSLAFQSGTNVVPLTQIRANFRLDLRAWDAYLETDSRTKDEPFGRTLLDLEVLHTQIQGLLDDDALEVQVNSTQTI
jgi:hypothetical protein